MVQSNWFTGNFKKNKLLVHQEELPQSPTIRRIYLLPSGDRCIFELVAGRLNLDNLKIVHKPHAPLSSNLVNVNDPVPTPLRCQAIYEITCWRCDRTQIALLEQGSQNTGVYASGTTQPCAWH